VTGGALETKIAGQIMLALAVQFSSACEFPIWFVFSSYSILQLTNKCWETMILTTLELSGFLYQEQDYVVWRNGKLSIKNG
jgi:hypothetical protein